MICARGADEIGSPARVYTRPFQILDSGLITLLLSLPLARAALPSEIVIQLIPAYVLTPTCSLYCSATASPETSPSRRYASN
jgi:hypothetical protein